MFSVNNVSCCVVFAVFVWSDEMLKTKLKHCPEGAVATFGSSSSYSHASVRALSSATLKVKVCLVDLPTAAWRCDIMASDLLNLTSTTEGWGARVVPRPDIPRPLYWTVWWKEGKIKCGVKSSSAEVPNREVAWKCAVDLRKDPAAFLCLRNCYLLWQAISLLLRRRHLWLVVLTRRIFNDRCN